MVSLTKKTTYLSKRRIATRFAQAAQTYDAAARVQRNVAQDLADLIVKAPLTNPPHVLEVGCGTGILTSLLLPTLQPALWHLTDLSPTLVHANARRMQAFRHKLMPRAMDGEAPDLPPNSVDLVVSNMVVQWFQDLEGSIDRLFTCLKPGGLLALTLPGAKTFTEWRTLCTEAGLSPLLPPGPACASLVRRFPHALITRAVHPLPSQTVGDFLSHLRQIGAHTHPHTAQPTSFKNMRQLIARYSGSLLDTNYEILTFLWRKV